MRSSEWIKITKSCEATQSCVISGNIIEVIHAAIQIVLSVSMTSRLLLMQGCDDESRNDFKYMPMYTMTFIGPSMHAHCPCCNRVRRFVHSKAKNVEMRL